MDVKHALVRNWLLKARRDLLSAKRLARGKDPYLDTAIYHCQQAAEKAIKGWLVYYDQSFVKTHDLRLLVTMASEVEPKFIKWLNVAEQISPYATAYRYPGEILEPGIGEFKQTFKATVTLYDFICSILPHGVSTPM